MHLIRCPLLMKLSYSRGAVLRRPAIHQDAKIKKWENKLKLGTFSILLKLIFYRSKMIEEVSKILEKKITLTRTFLSLPYLKILKIRCLQITHKQLQNSTVLSSSSICTLLVMFTELKVYCKIYR